MNYTELDGLLQGRCRESRKLTHHTYARRDGELLKVRLHETDILTYFPDGGIQLNSGGWRTVTTKDRMSRYLPDGRYLLQERGVWYLTLGGRCNGTRYAFADGMSVYPDGHVLNAGKDNPKADAKLKAKVKKYAELCASRVPLDKPSGGDCWYCGMQTTEGESLGDAIKDTDHLHSHMSEGYVVPSLVYNALSAHYNAPMAFWEAFKGTGWDSEDRDFGRMAVRKAVYRYILRRMGYAV